MAYVKVAVGLGGEASHDVPTEPPRRVVGFHGGAYEVEGGFGIGFSHGVVPVISAGGGTCIVVSGHMLAHRGGGGGFSPPEADLRLWGVSIVLLVGGWRWKTSVEPVSLYARAVFRLSGAWRSAAGGLQPAAP